MSRWYLSLSWLAVSTLALLPVASAYSFNIDATPQQCKNLTISITGIGGRPPYRALVIPFGQSPLPDNIEARRIVDQPFTETSVSFQLRFPTNSQFIVVVSDSAAFGSGGTSVAATVTGSDDDSCFDASQNVAPLFFYNLDPQNQIVQCQPSRLWWDPATVQGTPTFYGAIPGGESFQIPIGPLTNVTGQGLGFSWTPSVRGGSTVMLGAGDDRGLGAGGSVTYIVAAGTNPTTSCLNDNSPSSTPGTPAGGSYPTSTSDASTSPGGGNGGGSNIGAIVGGIVGALFALVAAILIIFFLRRRRRHNRHQAMYHERPDLFTDNEAPHRHSGESQRGLPQPDPYIVPSELSDAGGTENANPLLPPGRFSSTNDSDPRMSTVSSSSGAGLYAHGPPSAYGGGAYGAGYGSSEGRPGTPSSAWGASSAGASRKSHAPPPLRPVNIIQHDDAGEAPADEAETVELPPAYTNIRRNQ